MGSTVSLSSWKGTAEELVPEVSVSLALELTSKDEEETFATACAELHKKLRSSATVQSMDFDPLLTKQGASERDIAKDIRRKKARSEGLASVRKENVAKLQKQLKALSRRQVLEAIVPCVGKETKRTLKHKVKDALRTSKWRKATSAIASAKSKAKGRWR